MAIQDQTVTLKGSTAALAVITIYPANPDGTTTMTVSGAVADAGGAGHALSTNVTIPAGTPTLDNLRAFALSQLRKANGLEV